MCVDVSVRIIALRLYKSIDTSVFRGLKVTRLSIGASGPSMLTLTNQVSCDFSLSALKANRTHTSIRLLHFLRDPFFVMLDRSIVPTQPDSTLLSDTP